VTNEEDPDRFFPLNILEARSNDQEEQREVKVPALQGIKYDNKISVQRFLATTTSHEPLRPAMSHPEQP
jgi:hypothetical protein